MKKIIFIPPNGSMFVNDFSIQRICKFIKKNTNYETILITINEITDIANIDRKIVVKNEAELFKKIQEENSHIIFHRSWMLAYEFAAKLVKEFNNVILNIKDWNFSSKKDYQFLFGEKAVKDFESIECIFKKSKFILSHYTKEQATIWSRKYNVPSNKFIFFPEYCNEKNLEKKRNFNNNYPKIVFAGSISPSSYPEEFFLAKPNLRALKCVTKNNINVNYVLSEATYRGVVSPRQKLLWQDLLYEAKFNPNFNLIKGKNLDPTVLDDFHFGFFNFEYSTKKIHLNRYAVPSKFAFYLEAGLPIIINDKLKSMSNIVKENNLGVVFKNSDINKLHKILNKITKKEYLAFTKNIKKYKNKFTYNNRNLNEIFY